MTEESFNAIRDWVRKEAKVIAAEIAGHHPETIRKHREKAMSLERSARRALEVYD